MVYSAFVSLGFAAFENMLYVFSYGLSVVLLHGFYDACAMSGTNKATVIFYVFVVSMYVIVY